MIKYHAELLDSLRSNGMGQQTQAHFILQTVKEQELSPSSAARENALPIANRAHGLAPRRPQTRQCHRSAGSSAPSLRTQTAAANARIADPPEELQHTTRALPRGRGGQPGGRTAPLCRVLAAASALRPLRRAGPAAPGAGPGPRGLRGSPAAAGPRARRRLGGTARPPPAPGPRGGRCPAPTAPDVASPGRVRSSGGSGRAGAGQSRGLGSSCSRSCRSGAGGQAPAMEIEKEFQRLDQASSWVAIYQDIRHEASDFPCKVAKHPRNKNRNRYRDVSPFDHSRIKLNQGDNDYINASLIKMEEAQRSYILTQGPLPNTCGHFWEMVWEQKSRGVVMLNRVMEKGSIKCAQYWPRKEEKEMFFEDTNLKLTLISEDIKSYYTVRQLELENLTSQETREILHFHYTTWPDFGVPESPASFLNFLFKVRESGSLSPAHGPVVVHCSAGIGRSGTFCLVDTCLLLMDKRKDPSSVDVKQVLLEMRKYRMGLIQTADQLRFSYLAVIEGAKFIMGDASVQEQWKELSNEDLEPPPEHTPPPPRPPKRTSEMHNGRMHEHPEFCPKPQAVEEEIRSSVSSVEEAVPDGRARPAAPLSTDSTSHDTEARRRTVGETPRLSPRKEESVKENSEEEDENVVATWKPFLVNICMFTFLTAGAYLCYRVCFH